MTHARAGGLHAALFLVGFGTYLNLNAVQPLLPMFRQVFGASEMQVSLTVSASAVAVALTAPFAGVAGDFLGRTRMIVGAMVGVGIATALAATAATLPQLIAWRFLQGMCVPAAAAVVLAYVGEEAPAHMVGRTMASYVTGTIIGGFSGRFLNGVVAPLWGWRAAFLSLGVTSLVSAVGTGWWLPRSAHFVARKGGEQAFRVLLVHLHDRQLLSAYLVGAFLLLMQVATFTYVNFYLADAPFHLGPTGLSAIFLVYLLWAAVTPFSGRLVDSFGQRATVLGGVGVSALGMLITLLSNLAAVALGLTLLACGVFACQAAAQSHVGTLGGKARSAAAGLYISLFYLGGTLGSIVPGLFWNVTGWPGCVGFVLFVQLLAAATVYRHWTPGK